MSDLPIDFIIFSQQNPHSLQILLANFRLIRRLNRHRIVRLQRNPHRKGGSPAQLTDEINTAAHQLHQLLGNDQPQPRSLISGTRGVTVFLHKRLKIMFLEFFAHAASGIPATEFQRHVP